MERRCRLRQCCWPNVLLLCLWTSSYRCLKSMCITLLVLMQALCDMYADQDYLLIWQSRRCKVILEEDASSEDVLLAVWQVSTVTEHTPPWYWRAPPPKRKELTHKWPYRCQLTWLEEPVCK